MKKVFFSLIFALSLTMQSNSQVPLAWDTAKTQLVSKLTQINNSIESKWDHQQYCTSFAGDLGLANSNRGYLLFTPDPENYPFPIPVYQNALYAKIDTMLMAFESLGYTAVDLTVQYPMFVKSFPNSKYYLDFYKNVAQKIKMFGFKLSIGCQASFIDSVFAEKHLANDLYKHYLDPDGNPNTNDQLTQERYKEEKLQMLQTIIDSLQPDYLTIEQEPQTQSANLLHLIDYSVDSTISLINYFTENLNKQNVSLGAGAGSWDDIEYFQKIALTNVDFLDCHIYPVNFSNVDNKFFIIDSIADANNKKLMIGEAWCYKITNSELQNINQPVATSQLIYSRDVFDYWQSVDSLFVKAMVLLSQQSKIELVNFFWPNIMFGQLTYDQSTYGTMSPKQIINLGSEVGYSNMFRFHLSPIGEYTKSLITNICSSSVIDNEDQSGKFILFPNPTKDVVNFLTDQNVTAISIYNYLGENVAEYRNINNSQISFPTNLPVGVYFAEFTTNNGKIVKKIVKNK